MAVTLTKVVLEASLEEVAVALDVVPPLLTQLGMEPKVPYVLHGQVVQ